MRFIVTGNKRDYAMERLQALVVKYPNHISLLTTGKEEHRLGIFWRAATDFVSASNPFDSLDLETARGMIFGSAVNTTAHLILMSPSLSVPCILLTLVKPVCLFRIPM